MSTEKVESEREYGRALSAMLDLARRHIPAGADKDISFIKTDFILMATAAIDKAMKEAEAEAEGSGYVSSNQKI